ncbi:MAG: hypothetical protein AAF604_11240 [Acidobacteriota bacterium]
MARSVLVLALVLCSPILLQASEWQVDPDFFASMEARSIGPATMSGRVAAVDATAGGATIFVGAATGGVWRSRDHGLTWEPVFDDQPVASIGAVAIDPSSPERIWVGTGEGNPRNSTSVGAGLFRSDDGGETWRSVGLEASERIHRVIVDPTDPDTAWVAALGQAWGENPERGVFKTTDGGETWRKVLYVDERTGCADLVIDPNNPRKLLAAMWDYRRWPWSFRSGGPGSGLYLSRDGGESWQELTPEDGLPKGDLGRIGLAISASHPEIVYALIENEGDLALYRSDDGGSSWAERSTHSLVGNRPFYYADIRVDPQDPDRVYSLWSAVSVSNDGGKEFEILVPFRAVHPDHHALWIDAANPDLLINGNDGGIAISRDRGATWRYVANLPLAQFYHLRVDQERPYNVYGGMQDNGSWRGPSEVWENGGIRNHHWQEVAFGDGFDTVPMADDPERGYAMSQEGFLRRWDVASGARQDIRPAPTPEGADLRFNWSAAIALDPFDPAVVYYGSQFVHKSTDRGDSWTVISDDLTSNRPEWQRQAEAGGLTLDVTGAENFTSLVALAPSPLERGVLWAGSDDGRVHVTRDGGATWTSVEDNLRGVPANTWVPHIAPSPHAADTAFVVFDDHRRSNWTPYAFRVSDYGQRWQRLATDGVEGYALVIEQDPVDPDLLFLGTEFGLWFSLDGGESWLRWTHGLPTVSVMDLVIHPRDHDLILGTHGRAAYIIDDLRPLRGLTREVLESPLHLFAIAPAQQHVISQTGSSRFAGDGEFRGQNPPYGALINFSLTGEDLPYPDEERDKERRRQKREEEESRQAKAEEAASDDEQSEDDEAGSKGEPKAEIRVYDSSGERLRTFEVAVHRGLNRAVWNLRRDAFESPPRGDGPSWGDSSGPEVLPGSYRVVVTHGEQRAEGTVEVLADPRHRISDQDRRLKEAAVQRAGALQERLTKAIVGLREVRQTARDIASEMGEKVKKEEHRGDGHRGDGSQEDSPEKALAKQARKLASAIDELEETLWQPPEAKGIHPGNTPWSRVSEASWLLGASKEKPTAAQQAYLERAAAQVDESLAGVATFIADQVEPFREAVRALGLERVPAIETD